MNYLKISPLGAREGLGTFDTLFDTNYKSLEEAKLANDFVVLDFVKDDDGIIYIECYHIDCPENQKRHRLNIQHFPCGLDALDDSLACELASTLFKSYKEPIKEEPKQEISQDIKDALLWPELNVTQAKFSFKTHTLRWLFYRKTKNWIQGKNGWSADKMCKECKKGISWYIGFIFTDAEGKQHYHANCPECRKELVRIPNTNLSHKLYNLCKLLESWFWMGLDKIKLIRSGYHSRYDFGGADESYCVKSYSLYWGGDKPDKTKYTFFPRKWWQYIFIPKQK